jgi:hypothetical protein
LFWTILALLIVANMLYEARRGRDRAMAQRAKSLGETAKLAIRTAGVFAVMAVLWSLWSADSIRDWISLFSVVQVIPSDIAVLGLAFLGLTVVVGVAIWVGARGGARAKPKAAPPMKTAAVTEARSCSWSFWESIRDGPPGRPG